MERLGPGHSRYCFIIPLFVLIALSLPPAIASEPGPQDHSMPARTVTDARPIKTYAAYDPGIPENQATVKQLPSSNEARLSLGEDLSKLGRCEEAAKALQAVTNLHLRRSEADKFLGVCYFRIRRFDQAVSYLQDSVRLQPGDKEAWIFLSRSYSSSGRLKDAIEALKQRLSKTPHDVDALYWIGKYYDERAEQTYKTMVAANPDHYLVRELDGDQFRLKQDYEKALEAYRQALKVAPNAPGLHFKLGDVYWRMLKFNEAKEELERELKINPFHAQANFELGDIAIKLGELEEGIVYVEKAVTLNPRLVEAHRSLGRALLTEKQYEGALREFSIVAQEDPSDHTIHALLATTYRRMGRLNEAEEEDHEYKKLMEIEATNVQKLKALERSVKDPSASAPKD